MIVADTSGVFAALDRTQPTYPALRSFIERSDEPLVLSPFVLGELDYLLSKRVGTHAPLELLADVEAKAYELAPFVNEDIPAARSLMQRYRDLGIGLADASIVVLAERYGTNRVLTLDERHFRALRTLRGEPFVILPADA